MFSLISISVLMNPNPSFEISRGFYKVDVRFCEARGYGLSCCTQVFFLDVMGVLAVQVGEGMAELVRRWCGG